MASGPFWGFPGYPKRKPTRHRDPYRDSFRNPYKARLKEEKRSRDWERGGDEGGSERVKHIHLFYTNDMNIFITSNVYL